MQNTVTDKITSSSTNNRAGIDANLEPFNSLLQEDHSINDLAAPSIETIQERESDLTTRIQTITAEQDFNEAIIKLLVLLYQIDAKVTLTEQDYFDEIVEGLNWHSGVSVSAFVTDAIHQARVAIDQRQSREFLFSLASALQYDPAQALEYAMDITEVDGKRSEDEIELLAILSNRVLARGLVE